MLFEYAYILLEHFGYVTTIVKRVCRFSSFPTFWLMNYVKNMKVNKININDPDIKKSDKPPIIYADKTISDIVVWFVHKYFESLVIILSNWDRKFGNISSKKLQSMFAFILFPDSSSQKVKITGIMK